MERVCSICGTTDSERSVPTSKGTEYVCERCISEHRIHGYSYKPTPVFHGNGKKFFGIEIEVISRKQTIAGEVLAANKVKSLFKKCKMKTPRYENPCYLKEDSSIDEGYNFEIVTHPMSLRFIQRHKVFDGIEDCGVFSWSSPSTGLHIHVSREAFSGDLALAKLTWFYANPKNWNFLEQIAQRENNGYCRKIRKIEGRRKYLSSYYKGYDRRTELNFTNRATVEFRMFKGTVKPEAIYRAVEYVDAITDFCNSVAAVRVNFKEFVKFVETSRRGKNRRKWPHLEKWLKENSYCF